MLTPLILVAATIAVTRFVTRRRQLNAHIDRHRDTL
jgi:hypothetical protein